MTKEIEKQEQELEGKSLALFEAAHGIVVTDPETYASAGEFLKGVKDEMKKRKDFFEPMKKTAKAAHSAICDRENETLNPLKEADTMVREKVGVYLDEQDRIKREAQRKLEEQARRDEEKKRKELDKRIEAAKKDSTKERLEAEKEDTFVEPVYANHAVEKTTQVGEGSVTRKKDIKVTVVDELAFFKAIGEGTIPLTCVKVEVFKLKTWVKAADKIAVPGCRITETASVAVR